MMAGKAIKTGVSLTSDAAQGVPIKQSLKKRIPKALKEVAGETKWQSGSGSRRVNVVVVVELHVNVTRTYSHDHGIRQRSVV